MAMIAEIILIPAPGESLQESARQAARTLSAGGVRVREQVGLCQDRASLFTSISSGLQRSNILLLIGGMGEASGFLAKKVVSEGLRQPLEHSSECEAAIREHCEKIQEEYGWNHRVFASLPQGSIPFPPRYGKLPGCAVSSSRQHVILLPENPREILPMLQNEVLPYLSEVGVSASAVHFLRAWGIAAPRVEELLSDLTGMGNPVVAVEPDGEEVLVRVSAQAEDLPTASALCTPLLKSVAQRLGDYAYGLDVDSIQGAVVQKLRKKDLGLAIVESGTGGMLTRILTETEHGQEVIRYTTLADDDLAMMKKLGLTGSKLRKYGPVSEYAAVAMADGARRKVGASVGVAVIAVITEEITGLVYIAVAGETDVYVKKLVVDGEGGVYPDAVVDAAIARSLYMLRLFVDYLPGRYKGSIPLAAALEGKSVTEFGSYDDALEAEGPPRQSAMAALLGNFIIRKADEPKTKVKKAIFILAALIFLGCSGYLGLYSYQSYAAKQQAEELRSLYPSVPYYITDSVVQQHTPQEMQDRFSTLREVNGDIVGYLRLEGTGLNYPVVQGEDNEYYMRRDFRKNSSTHGAPFLDYRTDLERPSDNLVIYGHNMKDGQLFAELLGYADLEYYRAHPVISFDTVEKNGEYKVFAVFLTDAAETGDGAFAYHDFINAGSDEDFAKYVAQMKLRSVLDTGVEVEIGDELLTLSTCSYEFDNARFVVAARRIREGESREVATALAKENPQPLYPAAWYALYGGERPEADTASIVATMMKHLSSSASFPFPEASLLEDPDGEGASLSPVSSEGSSSRREEESRLAAESSREEESRRAEESRKAEESRIAEESSKAEASRLASEAAVRQKQEEEAGSYVLVAQRELDTARAALEDAESANSAGDAEKCAAEAEEAAGRAKTAADKAQAAADGAGTIAAQDSALLAQSHAGEAAKLAAQARESARDWSARQSSSQNNPGNSASGLSELTVMNGGKKLSGDPLDIIARIVQNEIGSGFHREAIKAHAVASYTYIRNANAKGEIPSTPMASSADSKVESAVAEVIGEAVYYNGKYAFTPYHATSAGVTLSSRDVWGGSYPYLVSVDSSVDEDHASYQVDKTITAAEVKRLVKSSLGIELDGDPEDWFQILDTLEGVYNGRMSVGGETKSRSGTVLTGRVLRENVLNLRSAAFDIDYDSSRERFTFTTYGYGHGVGMSQNGANLYASGQGWSYVEILEHYYPGTSVE